MDSVGFRRPCLPERLRLDLLRILLVSSFMSNLAPTLSIAGVGTYPSPLPKSAIAPSGISSSTRITTLPSSIALEAALIVFLSLFSALL